MPNGLYCLRRDRCAAMIYTRAMNEHGKGMCDPSNK